MKYIIDKKGIHRRLEVEDANKNEIYVRVIHTGTGDFKTIVISRKELKRIASSL